MKVDERKKKIQDDLVKNYDVLKIINALKVFNRKKYKSKQIKRSFCFRRYTQENITFLFLLLYLIKG